MDALTRTIVVGVTDRGDNTDALKFAARQATALRCGVTLVHVVHPRLPPYPESLRVADDSWESVANRILEDVTEEFRALTNDPIEVTGRALPGYPGAVFGDLSAEAFMVVLQHRDLSRVHRITTGSTVNSVVVHARCPVVSVPAHSPAHGDRSVVTVGLHADGGPREVLDAAFAEADLHRATLRLVHAFKLPRAYDVLLLDRGWIGEAEAAITEAAAHLTTKYPGVDARVDVRHDWTNEALIALSGQSDLLVIGRHGRHRPFPPRLGSLTRALVNHAQCPVMVAPMP
jgi:nucleotide-binding universal stress UspA family protein